MRTILKLMALLMTAMAFLSCIDEIDDASQEDLSAGKKVKMTFSASFDGDTRTTLVNDTEVWWMPWDCISINGNDFRTNLTEPAPVAEFIGEAAPADIYYAVYPSGRIQGWDNSKVRMYLPEVQTAIKGSFDTDLNISVASCTDDFNLHFKNVLGYVKIEVLESDKIRSVRIKTNDGTPLAGTFDIDCSDPSLRYLDCGYYMPSYVTMSADDFLEPGEYYLAMLPGTFSSGLTVVFEGIDGLIAEKSINQELTLEKGRIMNIGTTAGLEFVDINDQIQLEREALIALYEATGGENWYSNDNWCSDRPLSEWYGVVTDDMILYHGDDMISDGSGPGFVISLTLQGNNLSGHIPPALQSLKHLKMLGLSENNLTGEIPYEICSLTDLIDLNLGRNQLEGKLPDEIGNLTGLQSLDLSFNRLGGELPKSFYDMINLKNLWLVGNLFEGELSEDIADLKDLTSLIIGGNLFSGAFPEGLSVILNNPDMLSFDVAGNDFKGKIPDSVTSSAFFIEYWPNIFSQNSCELVTSDLEIHIPDYTLTDIEGNTINLLEECASNKLTIFYKFGTFCPFSNSFTAKLLPLYNMYKNNGLEVISYGNIDQSWAPADNMEAILRHNDKLGLTWPTVIRNCGWVDGVNNSDTFEAINDLRLMGSLTMFPMVFALDSDGIVVYENITRSQESFPKFMAEYLGETDVVVPDFYESTDYSRDGEVVMLQKASKGDGIDVILMGDAFVDKDMPSGGYYESVMRQAMEYLFVEEPMKTFRDYFNVYTVKVVSRNNFISEGNETAFSTYFGEGTLVGGNDQKCFEYALKVPEVDLTESMVVCILNQNEYAGTCYMYTDNSAVSYFPMSYDDDMFCYLMNHEAVGHGFGKLLDEYEAIDAYIDPETIDYFYNVERPLGWGENVDVSSDEQLVSWSDFLSDSRYASEDVGIYEGAMTYKYGAYRSSHDSIMRYYTGGFNVPSRYSIYKRIMQCAGEEYDYEKFVEYDAVNRTAVTRSSEKQSSRYNYVEQAFQPTAPPVVINGSWTGCR